LIDRNEVWWHEWLIDPWIERPTYRYLVRNGERVDGYLIFGQTPDTRSDLPYVAALTCTDFVWKTPTALRALLGFLGTQGPMVSSVSWPGAPADPVVSSLGTPPMIATSFHWMTRVLDPVRALSARGYPSHVDVRVVLRIMDDALAANCRVITLAVSGGRAEVTEGGEPEATLDVRGLAPLFTGWLHAADLARLELLRGAGATLPQRLDAIFAGPPPWMVEVV